MPKHEVQVVRIRLHQYGRYPNDIWRPETIPIGEVEIEGGAVTARDIIGFIKANFPDIPRHEIALVGWPEQKEYNLYKLVPTAEPEVEILYAEGHDDRR